MWLMSLFNWYSSTHFKASAFLNIFCVVSFMWPLSRPLKRFPGPWHSPFQHLNLFMYVFWYYVFLGDVFFCVYTYMYFRIVVISVFFILFRCFFMVSFMQSLSLSRLPKRFSGSGHFHLNISIFGIFVISYFLLLIFYYLFALFLSRGFSFSLPKDFPGHSTLQPLISCCIDCILHLSTGDICHWRP